MPEPTAVVVTHAHFDHFDPETLATLPKSVPVVVPPDRRMSGQLEAAGFCDLRPLGTWEALELGDLCLLATPSDAPVNELGLVVDSGDARFWHMSDAEPTPDTATRILSERGPVDVVSAKFQPADPQLNFQHNMGSSFDRRAVASWLEAAAGCAPRLAFPYASGLCFDGERVWLNRYAYPFSVDYVAHLLSQRLGDAGEAIVVRPGDVISIEGGHVRRYEQASPFVAQVAPQTPVPWEPFDDRRLPGLPAGDERREGRAEIERVLLDGDFASWLVEQSAGERGRLRRFRDWQVLGQVVFHLGEGQRAHVQLDFTSPEPEVRPGQAPAANYFTHVGAGAALRLLRGEASPLEVMLEGSVFIHDRIVALREGRLDAPATERLYEEFPDPLLTYGGSRRRRAQESAHV
jgi:hypothetical protein